MKQRIKKSLKSIFRFTVSNFYHKPKFTVKLILNKDLYIHKSYYPEKKQKSTFRIFCDQFMQLWKYGYPNEFYFMYGMDVKTDEECDTYINYMPFLHRRNYLNHDSNIHNSTCILRNKLYFDIFARSIGVPVPQIIAYFSANKLHSVAEGFKEITFGELAAMGNKTLFCKEMDGECGAGIFKLKIENGKFYLNGDEISASKLKKLILNSDYIFQELVVQHQRMSELYSGSINTMRLVTVRSLKDNKIHLMPSILRIGANGSFVDNTSQGGIAVGFDLETGRLNRYGFHKPKFGFRVEQHPNSGIRLNEFIIPFIKEAEQKAIFFHSMLKDIHSVGWDIAIGPDGPIFIEGNDNWEINGPQVGNHGLKKEFKEYFYK